MYMYIYIYICIQVCIIPFSEQTLPCKDMCTSFPTKTNGYVRVSCPDSWMEQHRRRSKRALEQRFGLVDQ